MQQAFKERTLRYKTKLFAWRTVSHTGVLTTQARGTAGTGWCLKLFWKTVNSSFSLSHLTSHDRTHEDDLCTTTKSTFSVESKYKWMVWLKTWSLDHWCFKREQPQLVVHKSFTLSLLKLIAAKTKVPDVSIYCKLMFPATVFSHWWSHPHCQNIYLDTVTLFRRPTWIKKMVWQGLQSAHDAKRRPTMLIKMMNMIKMI